MCSAPNAGHPAGNSIESDLDVTFSGYRLAGGKTFGECRFMAVSEWSLSRNMPYMNRAERRRQRKKAEKSAKDAKPVQSRNPNPSRGGQALGAVYRTMQDAIKLVWIASMPRSGSMWTYNVGRSVLRRAGRKVFPKDVPQKDRDMLALAAQGLQDKDPTNVWTLKVHRSIERNIPRSRFITTHRDPRDALVSFKRFMRCDFERALKAMMGSVSLCDHYRNFPAELCLHLEYRDIVKTPRDVVQRIAEHIGCPITSEIASEVVNEFSKSNVEQRIRDAEASVERRAALGDPITPGEVVRLGPRNQRAFDLTTGFQTGHVSDYREGDWKNSLTLSEKDRMLTVLGPWLRCNGYLAMDTPV